MGTTETQEQAFTKAEPTAQHQWLQRLVGEWSYETEFGPPGEAGTKVVGTETVRSLGELWVLLEGVGEMPGGGEGRMLMTLGFDPQKGHFVGTWIGSMMTYLWVYGEGHLDAAQRVLALESEGPSMSGDGGTARYRDVIEVLDDDHRVLTGNVLGEDGRWQPMMSVRYTRRGA